MKKSAFLVLVITWMMFGVSSVSAQDTETKAGTKEAPAEEAPAEEAPAEEAPAEEAPAEEAPAEEAPAEETSTEGTSTEGTSAEEVSTEESATEQTSEDEEDEEKKAPFRRPFAGTSFYWSNEFTALSLDRGHDNTYNPVYSMGFGLSPRWAISKSFSLSTNFGFNTELTSSDFSNKEGEVYFGDIPIKGNYKYSVDVNDDVKFGTGLGLSVAIPTSKMSRYATMYTSLGFSTKASFTFSKVLEGLTIGWTPKFTKYIHESENPRPEINKLEESGIPPSERLTSPTFQTLYFSGGENPSWSISNGLSINLGIVESLSFSFGYSHRYTYKYSATNSGDESEENCETLPEGCDPILDAGYNERGIYSHMFSYDLSYSLPEPVNMLTLSVGALTASGQLGPDGTYRTPFFNRETVITFGLSLDIDATVSALRGDDDEDE